MGAENEIGAADPTPLIPRLCRCLSERSPLPMVAVEGPTHLICYVNPAFCRLVGRGEQELVGRPFVEAIPEGTENNCLVVLDRVLRTGMHEYLVEQKHFHTQQEPVYWSYAAWAILGTNAVPEGVMIHVTDSTETAVFRRQAAAMNEALVLSAVRQHEQVAETHSLNDRLEERVAARTAELATANALLRTEIGIREAAEADRRELLWRLSAVQEEERRRIARDLHDQMGQLVTALGLGLKALENANPEPFTVRAHLSRLGELTAQIGREIHQIALDLRPTSLDDFGLETALANYVENWSERAGVKVDFQGTGTDSKRLPGVVETALYRVVQEALTNVLRHAGAHRVSVILQYPPGHAAVVVEDDGIGFETESLTIPAGIRGRLGLLGMQERVALLGGTLMIESSRGQGTTVIARVPLPTDERSGTESR